MRQKTQQGFTLLEMLVVLVIIGLLAGLVGPRILGAGDKAKIQTAEVQVKMLKGALQTLYLDLGRFPTQEEGLSLLMQAPSDDASKSFWQGPYLEETTLPLDPWNRPYQYAPQSSSTLPFALYSFGADGQLGGTDSNADIGILPAS